MSRSRLLRPATLASLGLASLCAACVPAQTRVESDGLAGRWIQIQDSNPDRFNLNYVPVDSPYMRSASQADTAARPKSGAVAPDQAERPTMQAIELRRAVPLQLSAQLEDSRLASMPGAAPATAPDQIDAPMQAESSAEPGEQTGSGDWLVDRRPRSRRGPRRDHGSTHPGTADQQPNEGTRPGPSASAARPEEPSKAPPQALGPVATVPKLALRLEPQSASAASQQPALPQDREGLAWPTHKPPLSPGDRLIINVLYGEEFSGLFEVDLDGTLNLPFLPPLHVAGRDTHWARTIIGEALVNGGFFRPGRVGLSVLVQQWAPAQVNVSGAVFQPGMVSVNVRQVEEKVLKGLQVSGDNPVDRFVPAALRAAGGVRPDAALDRIVLIRNGRRKTFDVSGQFLGVPGEPVALMSGDQIIVPSTGRFDEALVRPSPITPPGIRVFLSNLTIPAVDNSKSAINEHSTSVPYGTRMLTGLISANCMGGTGATNSARYGVLVTRNPISGETEVVERPIEKLMRNPSLEALNPYLMPNDGLACYDSGVTNLRDIGRTLTDILAPFRSP